MGIISGQPGCKDLGGGNITLLCCGTTATTMPAPPTTLDCEVSVIVDPGGANIQMKVLGTTGTCSGWPQFVTRPNTCLGGTVNLSNITNRDRLLVEYLSLSKYIKHQLKSPLLGFFNYNRT